MNQRILYPYQKNFLADWNRFRIVLKARQIGLSTAIALEGVSSVLKHKRYAALYVSASERQSMNLLSYAYDFLRPLKPKFLEETKTSFTLANGSSIYSLPNNPNTVRGFAADHVYLDEFAHFQDDKLMLQAIVPSISRGGRLTVVSTPLGKRGEFHRLWTQDPKFSKHLCDFTACPDLKIEELRSTLDEISFRQEYCCEFIDETLAYFPYELILSAVDDTLPGSSIQGDGMVSLGVDFGKIQDSTVMIGCARSEDSVSRVVHLAEFKKASFAEQLAYLEQLKDRLNPSKILVDATGYGIPLEEQARDKLGSIVEGVTLTSGVKESLITHLRIAFEGRQIKIPRHQALIHQLHGLRRSATASGVVRYEHEEGLHDDYVWALALAYHGCSQQGAIESCGVTGDPPPDLYAPERPYASPIRIFGTGTPFRDRWWPLG
ncbi:MAG: hypothetical protein HY211_01400 [Candidatus Omnitrophica bacterium]|nr:hypothetical protein [Candidatus Omnitrophota bacterium]